MHKFFISFIAFFSFLTLQSSAQQFNACTDAYIHEKVVSAINQYESQGYKLHLTREMNVPSGGYQPVTVSLKAGQSYLVNFIPFLDATQLKLVIIDKDNKTIVKTKGKKNSTLSHAFVAPYTGDYYIIVSQKMKKIKEVCGGVTVLSK